MNENAINIYKDLRELSDLEEQKLTWLGQSQTHISSYVELMCRLFDDNSFDNFVDIEAAQIGLNEDIINRMKELRDMLNSYQDKLTDKEILEDPEWHKIVNFAGKIIYSWENSV